MWHILKIDTCRLLREGDLWLIFMKQRNSRLQINIYHGGNTCIASMILFQFVFYSMHQRFSMWSKKMHSIWLAMWRSRGLHRSERRDRMREMQFQLIVLGVIGIGACIWQDSHGTLHRKYLHKFFVTALLRRKKMHVSQSYLWRNYGLSLGAGRAELS